MAPRLRLGLRRAEEIGSLTSVELHCWWRKETAVKQAAVDTCDSLTYYCDRARHDPVRVTTKLQEAGAKPMKASGEVKLSLARTSDVRQGDWRSLVGSDLPRS